VLPWGSFGWQLLAMPIFLILGILANAMGLFGAGDAKFIAAAAPFVWAADARLVGLIFMANLLAAYLAHRMAKHTALRALAPDWASWDAGAKFPMGLPLATSLMIYLAIASL
jgi:prepilin peptidase CpaA